MWDWFKTEIVDEGRLPLFLCFFAFLATFLTTRIVTRMIRAGRGPFTDNVSDSGLHVHHAVPGIVLMAVGGFMAVGAEATVWSSVAGLLFGIGASLALDEFALILRLDDVYWSEEGRISVELVAIAVACLGLVLIGSNPFRIDWGHGAIEVVASIGTIALHLALVLVTALKGKYRLALLATFIPLFATVGAIRLARPESRFARKRYGPEKMIKAEARAAHVDARYGRRFRGVADFIAGAPSTEGASE